jgi:hypothetical protein
VVPAAKKFGILVEVNLIDEEFLADGTDEAGWMPVTGRSRARRCNTNVTSIDVTRTLKQNKTIFKIFV